MRVFFKIWIREVPGGYKRPCTKGRPTTNTTGKFFRAANASTAADRLNEIFFSQQPNSFIKKWFIKNGVKPINIKETRTRKVKTPNRFGNNIYDTINYSNTDK